MMGKGKNGCSANLAFAAGETGLLELREQFRPWLKQEMDELLDQVDLIDGQPALDLARQSLVAYASGDGGPDKWYQDFLAEYRVGVAHLAAGEENFSQAISLVTHDSVPLDRAIQVLDDWRQSVGSARDRSTCRHALASLLYRNWDLDRTRFILNEDASDSEVPVAQRDFALRKLEEIEQAKNPEHPLDRLIPSEILQSPQNKQAFDLLSSQGFDNPDGQAAASSLLGELSASGYHREALALADFYCTEAPGDGLTLAKLARAEAVAQAGRLDQAISAYIGLTSGGGESHFCDACWYKAEVLYDQAGLTEQATHTARRRRDSASATVFKSAQSDYLLRLARSGHVEKVFSEIDACAVRYRGEVLEEKQQFVDAALAELQDPEIRSRLRHRLAAQLHDGQKAEAAISLLQQDISDSGVDKGRRHLAARKIAEIDSALDSA